MVIYLRTPQFRHSTSAAPRALRFFQLLLGWPVNAIDETYVWSATAAIQWVGSPRPAPRPPTLGSSPNSLHDVDSALAAQKASSGTRVLDPTETP